MDGLDATTPAVGGGAGYRDKESGELTASAMAFTTRRRRRKEMGEAGARRLGRGRGQG